MGWPASELACRDQPGSITAIEEPLLRRVIVVLAAVAGVVIAHAVGYMAIFTDGTERALHLHATGHGYWTGAVALAINAGALAAAGAAWWGVQRALARPGGHKASVIGFVPLALAQLAMYSGMEVTERLLAGAGLADLVHGHLFVLGLLVQVAVAGLAVLVLRLVASGSERVAARRRAHVRRRAGLFRSSAAEAEPTGTTWGHAGCRGPPGLLVR